MKNLIGKSYEIQQEVCANIPTVDGNFQLVLYSNNQDDKEHLAFIYGDIKQQDSVLVRVHSECFTGDVLGSLRCDCGEQLQTAMRMIAENGSGLIIYLRQEGRGIGLLDKLKAYNLQDLGYDTVDANLALGHQADERNYTPAALILKDLGVTNVRLMTNNPAKIENLRRLGVSQIERMPMEATITTANANYLYTKIERMNHLLELVPGNYLSIRQETNAPA